MWGCSSVGQSKRLIIAGSWVRAPVAPPKFQGNPMPNDKEWLDRVNLAAKHYEQANQASKEAIESFVKWIYALYGIVLPDERKDGKK